MRKRITIREVSNGGFLLTDDAVDLGVITPQAAFTTFPEVVEYLSTQVWPAPLSVGDGKVTGEPIRFYQCKAGILGEKLAAPTNFGNKWTDWFDWTGSTKGPVPGEYFVTVRLRNGIEHLCERANDVRWFHYEKTHPAHWQDVVAYKCVADPL